jgi:hypothetical protein
MVLGSIGTDGLGSTRSDTDAAAVRVGELAVQFGHCCATPSMLNGSTTSTGGRRPGSTGSPTLAQLEFEIRQGRPIAVRVVTDTQSGHLVIVRVGGNGCGSAVGPHQRPLKSANSVMTFARTAAQGTVDSWIGIG